MIESVEHCATNVNVIYTVYMLHITNNNNNNNSNLFHLLLELQPVVTRDDQCTPRTDKVAVKDFCLYLVLYCGIKAHDAMFFPLLYSTRESAKMHQHNGDISIYFTVGTTCLDII